MAQWITKHMVNDHIMGKNMVSSHLHKRLNILMVQQLQEAPQLLQSMRLDNKGIRQNHQRAISSRSSISKVAITGYSSEPTATPTICTNGCYNRTPPSTTPFTCAASSFILMMEQSVHPKCHYTSNSLQSITSHMTAVFTVTDLSLTFYIIFA